MSDVHLRDDQWRVIKPHLPPPARTGRPRADDRRTLEAILYVLLTGCRWQDLPAAYGAPVTAWRRLRTWEEQGAWAAIWRAVLAALDAEQKLDWTKAFLDGSFVPAKGGAPRSA
jgi:transposase